VSGRLQDKVAIVTGGVAGMGLGTVELFVNEGARVIVADIDEGAGRQVQLKMGDSVRFVRCDVTVEREIASAVELAEAAFGGLDIMFNNAGTSGPPVGVLDMTAELWDRLMALLVSGPMYGTKYAAQAMQRRGGGAIINTASVASFEAGWGPLAYSVGKAAVIQLTRCTAAELAPLGIRVNAICPGVIATDIFSKYLGLSGEAAENVRQMVIEHAPDLQPLRRAGLPEDIGRACLYLASDDSRFVTGTHIVVDGGLLVGDRHSWDTQAPAPTDRMGFTPENIEKLMAGIKP